MADEMLKAVPLTSSAEGTLLDDGSLRIDARQDMAQQVLLEIDDPGITSPVYALKGWIRYDDIEATAYLQMDNHFDGHGVFFTKSLADAGPLQKLSGSSDWREFILPFSVSGSEASGDKPMTPNRLTLSLQLPVSGSVQLRDLALHQYEHGEDPIKTDAWFDGRTMGLIGGIGGAVIGLWGALAGVLAGRGRARSFVIGSANVLVLIGIASLVGGAVALVTGQAYAVYFPILLFGAILVVVVGALRRVLPQRYELVELKKMQSMDA